MPSSTILTRRLLLVGVIERLIQDPSRVDLDHYESKFPCGTYRCVLGHYRHQVLGLRSTRHGLYREWAMDHFGIDDDLVWDLFGPSCCGSLEDRLTIAKELTNDS